METGRFTPDFDADKGFGGGSVKKESEILNSSENKLHDLEFVLSEIPTGISDDEKNKHKDRLIETKRSLRKQGIEIDAFLKKNWNMKAPGANEELKTRRGVLLEVINKTAKGEILNADEQNIIDVVKIKKENLFVEESEKEEAENIVVEEVKKGPWDDQLAIINRVADPKLQKEMRNDWLMKNLRDGSIPYSVIEAQLDIINQEFQAPVKENKNGENIPATEKKDSQRKVEKFSTEDEARIIQECYDLVFVKPKNTADDIKNALLSSSGFIAQELGRGKDPVISPELVEKINSLGLENWIDMRNVFSHWADFKGKEEVKENDLNAGMFMDVSTEAFFANKECEIPAKLDGRGRLINGEDGLVKVNLGKEIGKAMKIIRHHFADGLRDAKGRPMLVEYWRLIGDQPEKANLYKSLNINKYIGETAFTLLTSYQMLTDTSAEDFMSMMVDQADTRTKKYKISEERDAFARMIAMFDLAKGKKPFTQSSGDDFFDRRKETIDALAKLLPAQLIPTGLSGDGMAQLENENWLKWRVNENLYSRNQVDSAKIKLNPAQIQFDILTEKILDLEFRQSQLSQEDLKELENLKKQHARDTVKLAPLLEKVKPATDQGTRIDMMRSALTVLETIKTIVDPSSDINKLESLKGKLYRHMTGSFGDAKWLINGKVPAAFSFLEEDGTKKDIPLNEWISRTMMGVDKAFLYTHSIADHKCTKPWEMKVLAQNAEQLFRNEVQSSKGTFLGQEKSKYEEHRKDVLEFIDDLWNKSYQLIYRIKPGASPSSYPSWFRMGVSVLPEVLDVAMKSKEGAQIGEWEARKHNSRL